MKRFLIASATVGVFVSNAFAQMNFTDLGSYCRVVSEASTPTLLARTQGIPKEKAKELMQGMTDPLAIRMVSEVIEFAYARPTTMNLDQLRNELRELCLARRILVQ